MATLNRPLTRIGWDQPAALSNKDVVKLLSPSAVKGFLKMAALWELRDEDARQLLGGMSNGAFYELKKASSRLLVISSCSLTVKSTPNCEKSSFCASRVIVSPLRVTKRLVRRC